MLASLTANINRKEGTEPISYSCFLRYPAASVKEIPGLSAAAAGISLAICPGVLLAEVFIELRERVISTYIWQSELWIDRDN